MFVHAELESRHILSDIYIEIFILFNQIIVSLSHLLFKVILYALEFSLLVLNTTFSHFMVMYMWFKGL